jgi:hypothetical protein
MVEAGGMVEAGRAEAGRAEAGRGEERSALRTGEEARVESGSVG